MEDEDRAAARLEARREAAWEDTVPMRCEDCERETLCRVIPAEREGAFAGPSYLEPDCCPACGGTLMEEDV